MSRAETKPKQSSRFAQSPSPRRPPQDTPHLRRCRPSSRSGRHTKPPLASSLRCRTAGGYPRVTLLSSSSNCRRAIGLVAAVGAVLVPVLPPGDHHPDGMQLPSEHFSCSLLQITLPTSSMPGLMLRDSNRVSSVFD